MSQTRFGCSHNIRTSKYERNAPEISNWWYKLFDMMEKEASIPPHKRIDVLNDIFPEKILEKILAILKLNEDTSDVLKNADNKSRSVAPSHSAKTETCGSMRSSFTNLSDMKNRNEIGSDNPYLKFFKRRADRAAIWHTLPPLSLAEMNLTQKAEAITERIATDFVEWLVSINEGSTAMTLTVPKVLKLFEIGFKTHAAQSLQVRIRELLSVPTGVALLRNMPEMEKRSLLRRLIEQDVEASRKKAKVFAFGRKLAPEDQLIPPNRAEVGKWLVCSRVPPRLQTMAVVFQGITHLKSTRAFCEYLLQHPEIKRPEYLIQANMFDPVLLKKSDHALDAEQDDDDASLSGKSADQQEEKDV